MFRLTLAAALLAAAALCAQDRKDAPPKPDNSKISAFSDKPEQFKGKTLCFTLEFVSKDLTLNETAGGKSVAFTAKDPNNGAKLLIGIEIPRTIDLPKARGGEKLVIVFECRQGELGRGNVATSITRPGAKRE